MLPIRDSLQLQGYAQAESEDMEKISHANGNQRRAGVSSSRGITRGNVCASNIRELKYMKKVLTDLKAENTMQ